MLKSAAKVVISLQTDKKREGKAHFSGKIVAHNQ
jgi:hypothetical protein